ncbi:ANTAR domain-containing protein [Actinokineospora sp. PR83]|uniref:ANTAR domain-containing protein n=1 Tax=Actinokineospora sp. PR83 TaxID=2884908 RepID=UPI001F3AB244|nr:ANTAR domain-containing protein [Actinokineospora sp. PR83]MCG8915197.1 ANTAR domain-containing protein [Actinokineospora sp. PR83]
MQTALDSRVVEQAEGMLAVHSDTTTPEQAFTALRSCGRARHLRLSDLARGIVDGTTDRTPSSPTAPPEPTTTGTRHRQVDRADQDHRQGIPGRGRSTPLFNTTGSRHVKRTPNPT